MNKRVLTLMTAFCLLAMLILGGCGRSKPSTAAGGSQAKEVTLTMINRVNSEVQIENNALFRYIREKYGFDIRLEAPPINNYNERLQILMTSGDLPDLIYIWSFNQNYLQWCEQGLLNPVNDLVKDYPNIMHNISPDMFEVPLVPSTGKTYAVPRTNKVNRWGYMANVRWLTTLGVQAPTTLDEFYEFGKLVAAKDPDGNGQNDTFLISPDGDIFISGTSGTPVLEAFIPPNGYPDYSDGVYKVRERMSGYYPYLDYMRKLYAEKILDPEYIVNKTYGGRDKVFAGRVAVVGTHDSVIPQDDIASNGGAFDFLDFFPPLKGTDGKTRNFVSPAVWGGWALPASSKKTQDALRFLDWGNSPEGYEIMYNGVPGVTYNSYDLKSRTINQTDDQRRQWMTVSSSYMTISFAYEGIFPYCSNNAKINEYYNKSLANYMSKVTDEDIPSIKNPDMDAFNANNPDLVTRRTELENRYVTGAITRAELETFINNEYLPKVAVAEAAYVRFMNARK